MIENKLDNAEFIVRNVNDYYIVIKHIKRNDYEIANKECFALLSELIPHDFNLYQNDNNISIVPKCIDKRNAVEFLIQKHEPKLTIGIGDSLSDWNFMDLCDYKIIPKLSKINKIINLHIPK
jgi:hydroxymethylpyrimidine pyrophosphatase-like HAD family hydrolase